MNIEQIAEHFEAAVEAIVAIEQGDGDAAETAALQWRAMEHLAKVSAMADRAGVRAPGPLFVRQLIVEEVERLVEKCRIAVGLTGDHLTGGT